MNERTFKASEAHKLEDPERLTWLPPGETIKALDLAPGSSVADVGAGTGYFTLPLARAVGPNGRIYAIDLQREMLDLLEEKLKARGAARNIEVRQGTATATGLAERKCDLVFLANIWHELDDHSGALAEAARILAPGGRVAILDWRTDVSRPPGPPLDHRIGAGEVAKTLRDENWAVRRSARVGLYSYLVIAGLPAGGSPYTEAA